MKALIEKGVPKEALIAQGYGFYCPVDPAETEEAAEKNRRVEFKILYRKGKDLEQERGCQEATDKGIKPKKLPPLPTDKEADPKAATPGAPAGAKPAGAAPATPAAPAAGKPATPATPPTTPPAQ
jgi:hypothetical protein